MTERSEILDMMGTLQLAGMRAAYDEIVSAGVKRQHGVERVIGALLKAEIAAKQARSINYQMGIAKLPLAKELADLCFDGTPINAGLIEQLTTGAFLEDKRNVVLIGGTGTGKSHIAIGIARSIIRAGRKTRFFNAVDLVNKLEAEMKLGRGGRIADGITRVDLLVLDELGYLPFAQSGGQLLFHLISRLVVSQTRLWHDAHLDHRHDQPRLRRMGQRVRRRQDDHRAARPPHASLRHRRDRQRQLALQAPKLSAARPSAFHTRADHPPTARSDHMRLEIDGHAWNQGFYDGEQGRPPRSCPYDVGTTESWSWSSGYIEGKAARNGYTATGPTCQIRKKSAPAAEPCAVPLRSTAPGSAAQEHRKKGVNIARRSGVKVRRRLTPSVAWAGKELVDDRPGLKLACGIRCRHVLQIG